LSKDISDVRRFFLEPASAKRRQYEALRAYFIEGRPSGEVKKAFGYTESTFHVMCHDFRRNLDPVFFVTPRKGPHAQPKKSAARDLAIKLRKENHSIYEISEALKEQEVPRGATSVRALLKPEAFSALARGLDEERPARVGPSVEAVADAGEFALARRRFTTRCGGLFLFMPDIVSLDLDETARRAGLLGSRMIPVGHTLRSELALKLWSIERKSHVMALFDR